MHVAFAILPVLTAVALVGAYRLGRRAGTRTTIPWRALFQLVEHRVGCCGQSPAVIERELGPRLRVPRGAWRVLLTPRTPLDRRGAR